MKCILLAWMVLVFQVTLIYGHYLYKIEKGDAPDFEIESNLKGSVIVNSKSEKPSLKNILYQDLLESSDEKEGLLITERSFTNSHSLQFMEDFENEYSPQDGLEDTDDGSFKEPIILTDKDVKKAYKTKSYLFDQMRQRSDVASEDFVERKKRELPFFPLASQIASYGSRKTTFAPPDTYGMNLNQNGGYVWNNLNSRPSLYHLSPPSNGYENMSENPPLSSEAPAFTSAPEEPSVTTAPEETSVTTAPEENSVPIAPEENSATTAPQTDSGSSEDIYVNINRTTTVHSDVKDFLEVFKDDEITINNSDDFEPRELSESVTTEAAGEEPRFKAVEIPVSSTDSVSEVNSQEVKAEEGTPEPALNDLVQLKKGFESTSVGLDDVVVISGEVSENSEGQVKMMPEAPTLPPLNYDRLPDYIRESISTTERPSSDEKDMDGAATPQPVEDIPKTYGMNLTSGSGNVWNNLVDPPVSFQVGSTESNQSQEPQETTQAPIIDEPVTEEQPKTDTPAEEPTTEVNSTPMDIPDVTQQPESASNEPDATLPTTESNDESNTEVPEATSATPEISDSTDVQPTETENPTTEASVTEESSTVTDLPEILSTTEETINEESTDDYIEAVTTVGPEVDETELEGGDSEVLKPEEEPISNEKLDIMNELLKSDQFWEWLADWMSAYTKLMEKHIRKIAVQEICNARHSDVCPLDKPDLESINKDDKVIINGKEIELNDNFNQLRRGNKGHSVDATTIYGNSVGNEKVTNVFIFNPNNAKDILEGLKPENSSNVNIIIEENKEEDKGRSNETTATTAIPETEKKEIINNNKDGEAGATVPVEVIEGTTEKQIETVSTDASKLEDVKDIEKARENVVTNDVNATVADVEAVTLKTGGMGIGNVTEANLKT